MAQEVAASEGGARSVQGAQGGLCLTGVGTTAQAFTLTAWKGRFVWISATGADGFYNFHTASAAGGLDATATASDAASPDASVPGIVLESRPVRVLVPDLGEAKEVYLLVAAQASTAAFRVNKA